MSMGKTKTQVEKTSSKTPPSATIDQVKPMPEAQAGSNRMRRMPSSITPFTARAAGIMSRSGVMSGGSERAQMTAAVQRQLGNVRMAGMLDGLQAKIPVGPPGDHLEQEADEAATRVVSGQKVARISRIAAGGPSSPLKRQAPEEEELMTRPAQRQVPEEEKPVQTQTQEEEAQEKTPLQMARVVRQAEDEEEQEAVPTAALQRQSAESGAVEDAGMEARLKAPGAGRPLPEGVRTEMEAGLGADFSGVRVHDTAEDQAAAKSLNAKAFTYRDHVWMGPGASVGDRKLMAHELTHFVQQSPMSAAVPSVQRRIKPEDVAVEMIGRDFEVTGPFSTFGVTLKAGDKVTVLNWINTSDTVSVVGGGAFIPFFIPKRLLKPVRAAVAGLAPYGAGVTGQAASVEKSEKQLAAWLAKESTFKSKKGVELFKKERKRLEDLLKKRQEILNKRLIQETMFNRFDAIIKQEVDAANTAHGLKGKDALDPNLVKSMLFQESQLGTAGRHLEVPPSHPVKTRFNLGQVIDSSGLALMTLLEREFPLVMSTFMPTMRKDLRDAQKERKDLKKKSSLTPTESARLTELDGLARQSWEVFIWGYKSAMGIKFADLVDVFFASQSPALNVDYKFWIHMAVMWLFEKRKPGGSWPDAIRAYNGSGAKARHYRVAVVKRATKAKAAAKVGKVFKPGNI
jgi:hypothetical protein